MRKRKYAVLQRKLDIENQNLRIINHCNIALLRFHSWQNSLFKWFPLDYSLRLLNHEVWNQWRGLPWNVSTHRYLRWNNMITLSNISLICSLPYLNMQSKNNQQQLSKSDTKYLFYKHKYNHNLSCGLTK